MERRSTKRDAPRRRYTVDAFEGIDELQDIRSDDDDLIAPIQDDRSDEVEFDEAAEQLSDEDEMSGLDENVVEDASEDTDDNEERLLDENSSVVGDQDGAQPTTPARKKMGRPRNHPTPEVGKFQSDVPKTHIRGISDRLETKGSKRDRRLAFFGPAASDYEPVLAAWKRWWSCPTLPSRISNENGLGGMHRSFFISDDEWAREGNEGWDWYFSQGGKDMFRKKQSLVTVNEKLTTTYMPERQAGALPLLSGPSKDQQSFTLSVGQNVALKKAWKPGDPSSLANELSHLAGYKNGFVLNLGANVRCLDWAPNQSGTEQFLAVSLLRSRDSADMLSGHTEAPAFTPRPSHKSNVHIWRFQQSEHGSIDADISPVLELVLCTDWGDAKDLKWCPMSCGNLDEANGKRLGMLAGIWSDGAVRVLDIEIPATQVRTSYLLVEHAAFESRPPSTVCTCLTWQSSSRLSVGCANGCIAIWDLPTSLRSDSTNPRPSIYSSISSSYILSIATCYPSRPNLLLASTMAGYLSMTDLSRSGQGLGSQAATVTSNRVRIIQPLLIWHDFAQVAIHAEDSLILKAYPIRRIFSATGIGRAMSNATSLAVSPCHPFVLVGTAQGDVFATDPLKKVMNSKSSVWQQTWFAHEWRRPTATELDKTSVTDGRFEPRSDTAEVRGEVGTKTIAIGSNGVSRIVDGFKVDRVSLGNVQAYNQHNATQYSTVYEEKSAITALAWNPNYHVGGWAAAGMGDGLLRVEDIAT